MKAVEAIRTLGQEHARESLHVFQDEERRGSGCIVCTALLVLARLVAARR